MEAPLALAFTAGLVATVNPCGFAMLPAYLSFFLGLDNPDAGSETRASLARALVVGATVSAGFLVVFGVTGILVTAGIRAFLDWVPWVSIVIGVALVGLGIALLAGFHLSVALPKLEAGGRTRQLRSVFVFGVSYAIASLSCTLPVFLSLVTGTATRESFASGVATFIAYGAGMALVLVSLTVAMAAARHSLVARLRTASRHVDRIAGVLLVLAGSYIVYYWVFNLTTDVGTTTGSGPARFVEGLSADASAWIDGAGWWLPALLAAVIAGAAAYVAAGAARRARRAPKSIGSGLGERTGHAAPTVPDCCAPEDPTSPADAAGEPAERAEAVASRDSRDRTR